MIYLIRHGQAAASWGEHPDPGLSDTGQSQAKSVAEYLSSNPIESVISSPMARCQETASYFAARSGLELAIEPRVTEIPTPEQVVDRVPWLRDLMSGEWGDAPLIVTDWRKALLEKIASLPDNTAVFTHFVAINAVVGHLENTDTVTVFRPNYCSVTTLERTGGELHVKGRGEELDTRVL